MKMNESVLKGMRVRWQWESQTQCSHNRCLQNLTRRVPSQNQPVTKVQDGCQRSSETARPSNACPLRPECALCRLRVQAAGHDDGGGRVQALVCTGMIRPIIMMMTPHHQSDDAHVGVCACTPVPGWGTLVKV
jgi:hypothetical protein